MAGSWSGITTFQTGFPVRLTNTDAPSDTCSVGRRIIDVDLLGPPNRHRAADEIGNPRNYTINGTSNYYFNPAAFTVGSPSATARDAPTQSVPWTRHQ